MTSAIKAWALAIWREHQRDILCALAGFLFAEGLRLL